MTKEQRAYLEGMALWSETVRIALDLIDEQAALLKEASDLLCAHHEVSYRLELGDRCPICNKNVSENCPNIFMRIYNITKGTVNERE